MPEVTLRSWLRKQPQPSRIRIVDVDDNERDISLTTDVRGRWKTAEESILAARAVKVMALDDKGAILRATELGSEDGGETEVGAGHEGRHEDKALSRERRELAALLDRYGDRLNEAYEKGSNSSNQSHEHLVSLVETLSTHLTNAITNLHEVSLSMARVIQGQPAADAQSDADKALMGLVSAVAPQMLAKAGQQNGQQAPKEGAKK